MDLRVTVCPGQTLSTSWGWHLAWTGVGTQATVGGLEGTHFFIAMARSAEGCASPTQGPGRISSSDCIFPTSGATMPFPGLGAVLSRGQAVPPQQVFLQRSRGQETFSGQLVA